MNNTLNDIHNNFERDLLLKKLEEIFQNCDDQCENENYHEMIGLVENIFDGIKNYVKEENYEKVAKVISKQIIRSL
jgi:hypothetical protein